MRKILLVSLALVLCCVLVVGATGNTKTKKPSNTAAGSRESSILTPQNDAGSSTERSTAATQPGSTPTSAIKGTPVEHSAVSRQIIKEDPNYEANKYAKLSKREKAMMIQRPFTTNPNQHTAGRVSPAAPLPEIQSIYLNEGFENGGSIPAGWTDRPGGATSWVYNGGTLGSPAPGSVHGGSYAACFDISSIADGLDTLKAPAVTLHGNGNYVLHFWSWDNNDTGLPCYAPGDDGARVVVKYGSGSWQLLYTVPNNTTGWHENTVNITTSETAFQFAFVGYADWGCTDPYIDDVSLYDLPPTIYLSEGFENGGAIPSGWTDRPGGATAWVYNGGNLGSPAPGSVHGGSYAACFDISSIADGLDTLKAPAITLHGNGNYVLHFWSWDNNDTGLPCYAPGDDGARVVVKYGSGSWQLLYTVPNNTTGWHENTVNITTSETAFQFAFVGYADWGCTDPYIDDVSLYDNDDFGSCCYGDPNSPLCALNSELQCNLLGGTWLSGGNCSDNPCIVIPPNDDCANAQAITGPYPVTINGTTIGATVDCPQALNWNAVWYTINLPYAQNNLSLNFCPSITQPEQMGIITMADCNSCSNFDYADDYFWRDCGNGTEQVLMRWFNVPGPATIYFPCWNNPSADFSFICDVEQWAPPQPDFVITGPGTFTQGNTCGAGNDCLGHHSEDQVWQITLPQDGRWTFSLCNTVPAWDTWISLGNSLCSQDYGSNEDACPDGLSSIASNLPAGTYYLTVEGYFPSSCGPYQLDVSWEELSLPPPNDTCSNVTPVPLSDGQTISFEGTTVGATFDCQAFNDFPNVWIAFTTTEYMDITIDYCGTTPAFDNLWLNLAGDCDCSSYTPTGTWNRSECGDGNPTLHSPGVPPGTWYYPVLNDLGANGPYSIHVTGHVVTPPCVLECPINGIPENEPACSYDYVDNTNGGCSSTPPVFSPYEFGQVVCGQSGTFMVPGGQGRDTDWYHVSLTSPREIHLHGIAEFPMQLAIMDGNNGCPPEGPTMLAWVANYASCDTFGVNTGIVQPGDYWLLAAPSVWYGVPCGFNYQMWATADSVAPPPPNDECWQVTPALLTPGDTLTINGNNSGATPDCPVIGGYPVAWEAFSIDSDLPIEVDYCGTENFDLFAYVVVTGCPCDTFIMNDGWDRSCDGTDVKFWFDNLAAGTYYLPVFTNPNNSGPYTIHVYERIVVPPPDNCTNSNYSQPPDWQDGLINCRGDLYDGWIVDDFTTDTTVVLDSMYIRGLNDFFTDSGNAELLVMHSVDGAPGDTVFLGELPATITNINEYHFGLPTFWLSVSPAMTLAAGTYFIGLRSIGTDFDEFIGTAPVTGSECYYQSNFYHVPNFIPSSTPISEGGFGQAYDMNYCVFTHEVIIPNGCQYTPGDINGNGSANGVDIVFAVNYFKGLPVIPPNECHTSCPLTPDPFFAAGDVNGNCAFNGIDITYFVRFLKLQVPNLLWCSNCPPAGIGAPASAVEPIKAPSLNSKPHNNSTGAN